MNEMMNNVDGPIDKMESRSLKHMDRAVFGALKGLLSIPIIGTTLVGMWDGYFNSRMEDTVDRLSEAIRWLGEDKIDKEYVASEEFAELFRKAIHIRMLSASKEKAKFILGLLIESLQKDRAKQFSTSLKESFLSLLDRLPDEGLIFLRDFYAGQYAKKTKKNIYEIDRSKGIALDSLLSLNILCEENKWEKHITQSMLGTEFINYLQLLANNENLTCSVSYVQT